MHAKAGVSSVVNIMALATHFVWAVVVQHGGCIQPPFSSSSSSSFPCPKWLSLMLRPLLPVVLQTSASSSSCPRETYPSSSTPPASAGLITVTRGPPKLTACAFSWRPHIFLIIPAGRTIVAVALYQERTTHFSLSSSECVCVLTHMYQPKHSLSPP